MTAVALPNAGIKAGYLPLEDGWGQDMNKNLRLLDALLQAQVSDKDLTTPPGSPTGGSMYIVPAGASGAWNSQTDKFAIWMTGDDLTGVTPIPAPAWNFVAPKTGWRVYVVDEGLYYRYSGTAWVVDNRQPFDQSSTGYTFVAGDGARAVRDTASSAATYTVPPNSTTAFPLGTVLELVWTAANAPTLAAGAGVTLNVPSGYSAKPAARYGTLYARKVATDTWDVYGLLTVTNPDLLSFLDDTATTYTFGLADNNRKRRQNNASAITLTVPPNSTTAFPVGSILPVRQVGAGAVTIANGAGVTFNIPSGRIAKCRAQGSELVLHKVATDAWDITGDLST